MGRLSDARLKPSSVFTKIIYRPIEAAIRWSGRARHEREIVRAFENRPPRKSGALLQWPDVQLNLDRILDVLTAEPIGSAHQRAVRDDLSAYRRWPGRCAARLYPFRTTP